MTAPIVDDGPCTITSPSGHEFTANGAYVNEEGGCAYVDVTGFGKDAEIRSGTLTDWHGNEIGTYHVTGRWYWRNNSYAGVRMASIRATIQGREYTGKLGYDYNQLVRLRRAA
jgi:hypothetical protein